MTAERPHGQMVGDDVHQWQGDPSSFEKRQKKRIRSMLPPLPSPGVERLSAPDAFEMGFEWAMMLRGQTLEDSRAVGRTLGCDLFDPIADRIRAATEADGFNSFEHSDHGIVAAKKIIRAALSALPLDGGGS